MARLRIEDIIDLTTSTRPNEGLGKLNDLASRLTSYVFTRALLEQDKITYDGGTSIKSNFLTDHNNSAAMVGLHEVIEPNIPDVLQSLTYPGGTSTPIGDTSAARSWLTHPARPSPR